MDMQNIRIMLKGVQLPDTETRMVIMDVDVGACPEGLKYLIGEVQQRELKAKARNQEITKADTVDHELDDLYFQRNWLQTTRLDSPEVQTEVVVPKDLLAD
jgi:hypothetical protein